MTEFRLQRRISASGTFSASGPGGPNFGFSAEFQLQGHFQLPAPEDRISASAPNFSFRDIFSFRPRRTEFRLQRRISASGTFSASGPGGPNFGFSAEFQLQGHFRLQAPEDRISASAPNFSFRDILGFGPRRTEFRLQRRIQLQGHFRLQAPEDRISASAPNFSFRDIFGFRPRRTEFRLQRRISASGTF